MKSLINSSNLHSGGGVQVAISFLYELTIMESDFSSIHVVASSEVAEGLLRLSANTQVFGEYLICDTFGLHAFNSKINNRVSEYNVVFTIFGPNYLRIKAKTEIIGFAQPWMLSFDNPISNKMSFLSRNILRAKFYLQWLFFLRADHYVVELEHVKEGLVQKKGVDESKIDVVYNTVSSLYENKEKWSPVLIKKNIKQISLGMVTRDYPHKNINILSEVAEILENQHNLKVCFYVTLDDTEWATKSEFFKKYVFTVGSLSPEQCPSFYQQMDGVVFPSLLECFSATPLEAMVMGKPLFASDRSFVRDSCAEYAVYFDPLDANDIALKIAKYFKTNFNNIERLDRARNHALNFSSAKVRAEKYLEIIQQQMKG